MSQKYFWFTDDIHYLSCDLISKINNFSDERRDSSKWWPDDQQMIFSDFDELDQVRHKTFYVQFDVDENYYETIKYSVQGIIYTKK